MFCKKKDIHARLISIRLIFVDFVTLVSVKLLFRLRCEVYENMQIKPTNVFHSNAKGANSYLHYHSHRGNFVKKGTKFVKKL